MEAKEAAAAAATEASALASCFAFEQQRVAVSNLCTHMTDQVLYLLLLHSEN
jgi:hypothetical protein